MVRRAAFGFVVMLFVGACAQVPKEAVELSATVGRDLSVVYRSHRQLAQLIFTRMRRDVDRFVDNIYVPFQVSELVRHEVELDASRDEGEQDRSLVRMIEPALKVGAASEDQALAFRAIRIFMQMLRDDVENLRKELKAPLDEQEAEVLGSIDRAYQTIHYANSIVTGHLASVVKVHEMQSQLLGAAGIDKDLPQIIGISLSKASDKIGAIVGTAEAADEKLGNVMQNAADIKTALNELKDNLNILRKED